jgi:hypothetical protein
VFPPLLKEEVERTAERVKMYGQREPIEILDGAIVAGFVEYQACVAAGVQPELTSIEEPADLVEYIVRRNVPRHLSKLDRACIAVLAQVEFKKAAHERKREGGRLGGLRAGKLRATVARSCFDGERWTHTAARVVGTTEGAVRRLAQLYTNARDVFDAVRERRLEVLRDARDLAQALKDPIGRAEVLRLRKLHPKLPVARLVADVMRARRPGLPSSKGTNLSGKTWTLYAGPMAVEAKRIPSASIDLVHADIVYGAVEMATEVARISERVLAPGGVLALIAGVFNPLQIQSAVADQGLMPLAIGALFLRGLHHERPGRQDRVQRVDALPLYCFVKGARLAQPIKHLGFVSEQKAKDHHHWQKNAEATLDLVGSIVSAGARVLDPCCGSGTTGEAALKHRCTFIGIDNDPEAVEVASARLAKVERELREVERGGGTPGLVKARRKGTRRRG